jgi:LysR family transcriptional regulator for bpeEF and oprC
MADSLGLMRTFCEVAAAGSFSIAARRVGLSRAAVSLQIAQLETRLGTRLFTRTTRRVVLTPEGECYAIRAQGLVAEVDALENEYAQRSGEVAGLLTVEVPEFIGTRLLAGRIPELLERHPALKLDLILNEHVDAAPSTRADVFLRFTLPPRSGMRYRALGVLRLITAASPDYVARHGAPRHPREIPQHTTIDYVNSVAGKPFDWEFEEALHPAREPLVMPAQGRLCSNNSDACLLATLGGLGLYQDYRFVLAPHLANGSLVQVLPGWHSPAYPLYALWHPGKPVAPRLTAFIEFLTEVLAGPIAAATLPSAPGRRTRLHQRMASSRKMTGG